MTRRTLIICAAAAATLVGAPFANAAENPEVVPGEAIVKFRDAPARQQVEAMRASGTRVDRWLPNDDTAVVRVMGSTEDAIERLHDDPRVEWAEPNYMVHAFAVPNDAMFLQQWGLSNSGQNVDGIPGTAGADIGVTGAWDTTTGGENVSVAIVDGGIDYTHPDLVSNITLSNPGETGGGKETNGVDDDGNGLVDDWRGWDWVADDNDPMDESGASHGTRVAGIVGARGNDGVGVSGTAWRAQMMGLRVLDATGAGTIADVAAAFSYAGRLNIRIVNASLGSPGLTSQALSDSIATYPDTLFVFAAGNNGANNDGGASIFPCDLPHQNVLCVASTNQSDALSGFSNFGAASVDIGAPGENIASTARNAGYSTDDGTSFAAPYAAGVAGLVLAANPSARTSQLKGAITAGATPLGSLAGKTATGGRLNAVGALASVPSSGGAPVVATGKARAITTTSANLAGTVVPNGGPASYYFEYGRTREYGSRTWMQSGKSAQSSVNVPIVGLTRDSTYHYRAVAVDFDGTTVGPNRTFRTAGGKATVRVRVEGRKTSLRLGLPQRTTVSATLQRRTVVTRNNRRVATFRKVRKLRARAQAAGINRMRSFGRLAPGRYRVSVRLKSAAGARNLVRKFRVNPRRPKLLALRKTKGKRRVSLRLYSRARVSGQVQRLQRGRFVTVRRLRVRTLGIGARRMALPRGLPKGRYRVTLAINEGGRKTRRTKRFRV
jgi:subtilisin family serine protease